MTISVDSDRRFPIVDVRIVGAVSAQDITGLLATCQEIARGRNKRMAVLVDMRRYDALTSDAAARSRTAAIYRKAVPALSGSVVCEARVVSSAIARYIITALDWLTGTPWPTASFTAPDEAEQWVKRQLAEDAGITPRPSPPLP
jgi:hypothetical protein